MLRRERRERDKERNTDGLLLLCASTRVKSATQVCALTQK